MIITKVMIVMILVGVVIAARGVIIMIVGTVFGDSDDNDNISVRLC